MTSINPTPIKTSDESIRCIPKQPRLIITIIKYHPVSSNRVNNILRWLQASSQLAWELGIETISSIGSMKFTL